MAKAYRVSSTVRVEQMEAELSAQLQSLRMEIEENGVLQGTPSKSYSSVLIPKDVFYFRAEREQVLRRGLQVAAARSVVSQADVVQTELESCLSCEYTPASLPLLLHQFYSERSYQLAQCKYLLMLRWKRFCRHSAVMEQLYPLYKEQVAHLSDEYEDAVQRARRLAVSREKILSGRGNPVNAVTQRDVAIYLQWLVCHLHSAKTTQRFLQVLHYLPASERREADSCGMRITNVMDDFTSTTGRVSEKSSMPDEQRVHTSEMNTHTSGTSVEGIFGSASEVPLHSVILEEFRARLQPLVSHFQIRFDTRSIRSIADETELFSMVSHMFREVFKSQEAMKTFLQYDSSEAADRKWGRKSPSMALRKEANWTPYIQIKPKIDPWQQKLITKLKERGAVDELLRMHCRFLQVSDPLRVTEALKQHAARVCHPEPIAPLSVTPRPTGAQSSFQPTGAQSSSQIWASIYSMAHLFQDSSVRDSGLSVQADNKRVEKKNQGCSYVSSAQLLGLEDDVENGSKDPVMARSAYLSLLYLRHLRIRELQHTCLSALNYLRSVERTLTLDTAGLRRVGGELLASAEESGWMSAARGGSGARGGLGSHHYIYNTPADYKVHCSEFMEFPEVENLHDFYSAEGRLVHVQDQRGLYVVYDAALTDLQELEHLLLLVASHYIHRSRERSTSEELYVSGSALQSWARMDVDRLAVLLDLWTCEAAFIEDKMQLLNCYFEAYQHVTDPEERFSMAQVITDIMHRRPQLDLAAAYFVQAYREEMVCLRSHQQLIKLVLNCQIDKQRQYLQRIWRGKQGGTALEYGLPPNYVPKQLVSLGGGSPALQSVFLLELHPSLGLACGVYRALAQAHAELCQLRGSRGGSGNVALEHRLLERALRNWHTLASPGASYSSQTQKDLFSDEFFEDPILVRDVGVAVLRSAEEGERKQGQAKQVLGVETFSKLLELVTVRHRLTQSASETEHLSQLYTALTQEMGFDEFHLYVRPVQFELAVLKERAEQRPLFVTALLQDSSSVDRYTPSCLPLCIQELDENQIGKFSFRTEEAVVHLMNTAGIENLQVALACQVTQKNALIGAVKQASLCYWSENSTASSEVGVSSSNEADSSARHDLQAGRSSTALLQQHSHATTARHGREAPATTHRLAEAFVSIQLEKVGPRDEVLNAFVKKKEVMSTLMRNPDEVAKIKRRLILEFCRKFSMRMSQCCVRGQIVALYHSLASLLAALPDIRQSHFLFGQANEAKAELDSELGLRPDPRTFQTRPRRLLSADGKTLLNLWFIPHYTEVLIMFKTLDDTACRKALRHTLEIVSALHDIVHYLVSFARLGNPGCPLSSDRGQALTADWGGSESIGAELWDVQQQIDSLCDPQSPEAVGRLLQLRREVLFLRLDAAVRYMIREAFLSSGNSAAYQSVSDNMGHALPLLSDSLRGSVLCSQLALPEPLEPHCPRAQIMYPWRCFLAQHGLFPLDIWDIPPIEYCMQLCLSGLDDRSRTEANGEILGVALLMDDVLSDRRHAAPLQLQNSGDADLSAETHREDFEGRGREDEGRNQEEVFPRPGLHDPTQALSTLRGFLLLWKQLEVFKESWARRQLGVEQINTLTLYKRFSRLYRVEVLYPSMKGLAQLMGKEEEYETLLMDSQPLLPPAGAAEVDVKTWQLIRLLESTECDMIRAVQRRLGRELTLVISERARQDTGLPTELWKKASMKHSLSPERPQIVERFVQQLMEGGEEAEGQVTFSQAHLQECVAALGGAVMGRERGAFLLYSQFYEHILQQQGQLLYQREQDVKDLEESKMQTGEPYNKVAELCRGLMVEVTALRARLAQLEEEHKSLHQRLSLAHRQRYDALVRQLLSTCVQLKSKMDEHHVKMDQDVSQLVNRARREGVDKMIKLKKRFGSAKDNVALTETQSKEEDLHDLRSENSQLAGLLCKLRALGRWKKLVGQGKLHRELLQSRQRELWHQQEAVRVKMAAEEEGHLLRQELDAVRDAMLQCQAECDRTRRQLIKQSQQLQEVEHRSAQEARSRQELDSVRLRSLEQLQEDAGEREQRLRALSGQLERSSQDGWLQRQRSHTELRQVRGQLHQERSLKLEAFQRVGELQSKVYTFEATRSRCTSTSGLPKKSSLAAQASCGFAGEDAADGSDPETGPVQATARKDSEMPFDRPKTSPCRLRIEAAEVLLPSLI